MMPVLTTEQLPVFKMLLVLFFIYTLKYEKIFHTVMLKLDQSSCLVQDVQYVTPGLSW